MSNGLPAMEGKTSSEIFAQHFNALQAARKAFTESENSERVRKALMRKVCTNLTEFENCQNPTLTQLNSTQLKATLRN